MAVTANHRTQSNHLVRPLWYFLSSLIFLILLSENLRAAVYYVATSGNDSNPGSKTAPWRTINKAKATAVAGDTILIRPGNYGSLTFSSSDRIGSSGAFITYKADPETVGPRPTDWWTNNFDPRALSNRVVITQLTGQRAGNLYLEFNNIDIHGGNVDFGSVGVGFLRFINMNVSCNWTAYHNTNQTGFQFRYNNYNDLHVEGCYVEHTAMGIYVSGTVRGNIVFRGNHVYHTSSDAIRVGPGDNFGTAYIENNHLVWQQVIPLSAGADTTHGSAIALRSDNIQMRGNIIHNSGNTCGIRSYHTEHPVEGYHNIICENNLIYNPAGYYAVEFVHLGNNCVIRNNTLASWHYTTGANFYSHSLAVGTGSAASGATISIYNNILAGKVTVGTNISSNGSVNNNICWYDSFNNLGSTRITYYGSSDPLIFERSGAFFVGGPNFDAHAFDDRANWNFNDAFKLAPGSPAIGFASPAYATPTDLLGNSRDSDPDAGCYEYGATTSGGPVLSPIGDKTIGQNQNLSFTVNATDPEGDPITYSAQNLPAGASFSNKTFSWTPTSNQAGPYQVTFIASDLQLQDSETITISVGYPPQLQSISNKSVNENALLTFVISATDPDNNPLTYSAVNLPAGASFNTLTHTFSWTPQFGQQGSYSVTFSVSDGAYSDSQPVTITVNPTDNDSDGLPDAWELQFFGNLNQTPQADPDNDGLTNLQEFLAGTDPTAFNELTSTSSWQSQPIAPQTGVFTLQYDAIPLANNIDCVTGLSYGPASSYDHLADTTRLFVNGYIDARNGAVYAAQTSVPYQANKTYHFRLEFDIPQHKYNVFVTPQGDTEKTIGLNYAFRLEQAAVTTLDHITVAPGGPHQIKNIQITLPSVNRPPVLNPIGNRQVTEASLLSFTLSATDPDNDPLTFAASPLPAGATLNPTTGLFNWTPITSQIGSHNLTFTVTDSQQASDSEIITISVVALPPTPPTLTSSTSWQSIPIAPQTGQFILEYDAKPLAANIDGVTGLSHGAASWYDDLAATTRFFTNGYLDARNGDVYQAQSLIPYQANKTYHFRLDINIPTHRYSVYVTPEGGSQLVLGLDYLFRFEQHLTTIYDHFSVAPGGPHEIKNITISAPPVTTVNQRPVLNPIGNRLVNAGTPLTFLVTAIDPDGDPLTYSVMQLPTGAAFQMRTFTWTPTPAQLGAYQLTFLVSDGHLQDAQTITITVQ